MSGQNGRIEKEMSLIKYLFDIDLISEETTTMNLLMSNDWFYEEEGDKVWVRKEKSNCLERAYFVE